MMSKNIKKEARIVKRKNKWCVVSHKNSDYRNFGCYDSESEAKKRLSQIYGFKRAKATILSIMTAASDDLEKKGMVHISDAIISCAESVAIEEPKNNIAVRIGKIVNLLQSKNENKIAEQLDVLIPEVLSIEECGVDPAPKSRKRLSADRAYNMVKNLYDKYVIGLIDRGSFEHTKMKEMKAMLKNGFTLSLPESMDEAPENVNSWWEYFSKRGNK
jgi:hypothetical protein